MRFLVTATSSTICNSDAPSSIDLEVAMNAATVSPVNGGGRWLSSQSRITRNSIGRAISCAAGVEGTTTVTRVYETTIENDPQLIESFKGILRDRVSANLVNLGTFNVSVSPFNEYNHGQISFWQGPHAQTRTRDFFGNVLSDSESPFGPSSQGSRPQNLTEELRDTLGEAGEAVGGGVGRGIRSSGFSPWMIFGALGLIAIIVAAPTINTGIKSFMELRKSQKESVKIKRNPRKKR